MTTTYAQQDSFAKVALKTSSLLEPTLPLTLPIMLAAQLDINALQERQHQLSVQLESSNLRSEVIPATPAHQVTIAIRPGRTLRQDFAQRAICAREDQLLQPLRRRQVGTSVRR